MTAATDRELLELAAKAVGWTGWRSKYGYWNVKSPEGKDYVCCKGWGDYSPSSGETLPAPDMADALQEIGWNPLYDDGETLRLAVMLGIKVTPNKYAGDGAQAEAIRHQGVASAVSWVVGDPGAQVRRAIVMVAAEIGRQMP